MTTEDEAMAMLRELHGAMADVMELRRLSETPEQRAKAEAAIAAWRKAEAFIAAADEAKYGPDRQETDDR